MEIKDRYTLKDKLKAMGPGILVVGSFIGPGTVTSATKAGAGYGYALLWTVVFSVIAVIVMQEMAARLGIVTQNGLAEELVKDLSDRPPLKWLMVALVAAAITLGGFAYMGGDLTGTVIGLSAITGIPQHHCTHLGLLYPGNHQHWRRGQIPGKAAVRLCLRDGHRFCGDYDRGQA